MKAVLLPFRQPKLYIRVKEKARKYLIKIITEGTEMERVYALNVIDHSGDQTEAVQAAIKLCRKSCKTYLDTDMIEPLENG